MSSAGKVTEFFDDQDDDSSSPDFSQWYPTQPLGCPQLRWSPSQHIQTLATRISQQDLTLPLGYACSPLSQHHSIS
jgi:hypothetical protein